MPYIWRYDAEQDLLYLAVEGEWETRGAGRALVAEVMAAGHWSAHLAVLIDLLRADASSAPHYADLAARIDESIHVPRPRRVAIVSPPGVTFGIGRMLEGLAPNGPAYITTFQDIETALAWLGVTAVPPLDGRCDSPGS